MINDTFFFRLYVLVALVFLLLFSCILSWNLYKLLLSNIRLLIASNNFKKTFQLTKSDYINLSSLYSYRQDIFLLISLSKLVSELHGDIYESDFFCLSLADCYMKISFYGMSEYYYLKILLMSPSNLVALLKLAEIYEMLGYQSKSEVMISRARQISSNISL